MALVVNTNVASLVAQKNLGVSQSKLDTAMERLSSGSRINSASDDAAGLAIASRMESQVRGLNQAVRNANDGISLAQTAEGAMEEITSMLQRMRELSVQAANGTNSTSDRASLQTEISALASEIDRIASTTEFNGKALLDGSFGHSIQIGSESGQSLALAIGNMATTSLGGEANANSSSAVTSASFAGSAATATKSTLTFNADDTYNFALVVKGIDATPANDVVYNITGSIVNGSAKGVVDAINTALRGTPAVVGTAAGTAANALAADSIRVSYIGNTVTIENLTGEDIDVKAGLYSGTTAPTATSTFSASGGTMTFASVVGDTTNAGAANDNKVIGDNQFAATSLRNNGPVAATATVTQQATPASMTFTLGADTAKDTAIDVLDAGSRLVLDLTANGVTKTIDTGTMNAIATGTTTTTGMQALKTELDAALATAGLSSTYAVTVDATNKNFTITRADGVNFSAKVATGTNLDTAGTGAAASIVEKLIDLDDSTTTKIQSSSSTLNLTIDNGAGTAITAGLTTTTDITLKLTDASGATVSLKTGAITTADRATFIAKLQTAITNSGAGYTVAAHGTDTNSIAIVNTAGDKFSVEMTAKTGLGATARVYELLEDREATTAQTSEQGKVAVTGTPATAASTSIMYLDLVGNDTYTMKGAEVDTANSSVITANKTAAFSFSYDGTASSLTDAAVRIQSYMNTIPGATYSFTATVVDGRIKLEEANGKAFAVTDFASTGAGKIVASVETGQQVSGAAQAVMLDDTQYARLAGTDGAGSVVVTDLDLQVSGSDTYSFNISDGTATAVVAPVKVDGTKATTNLGTDLKGAIEVALTRAGLNDVIKVNATAATATETPIITLTHALGKEIKISDFVSLGSQTMMVSDGDGTAATTGILKVLDDDGGVAASETVSKIAVTSDTGAANAITVIDRAIGQVATERGNLGAIQNRLNHTVNNLTNISVNTAAAQSRIEDADYAVEAANLAKAQIMQQAGTAMLAQANAMQQTVLSLLQ